MVFVLLVGFALNIGALSSKADELTKEQENLVSEKQLPQIGSQIGEFNEDGIDYVVTSYEEGDYQYSQVVDTNGEKRKDLIFSNNKKNLRVVEYKKVGTELDNNIYEIIDSKDVNLDSLATEIENNLTTNSQNVTRYKWNKRHYDMWKGDMWYSRGVSGYGNEYLRIGCKATYRLPIYKLESRKESKCNAYVNNINTCNKYMKIAIAELGAGGTAAIVAAATTAGPGGIIAYLGTVGIVGKDMIEAYQAYDEAVDLYNVIKYYGECE